MLLLAELKDYLHYYRRTGLFIRLKKSERARIGDVAGYLNEKGYVIIKVKGRLYRAHRLAWFYVYGVWPKGRLDHRDTIKHHNWIKNLREATNQQNLQNRGKNKNNTSGYKGVSWCKNIKQYVANICVDGKTNHL